MSNIYLNSPDEIKALRSSAEITAGILDATRKIIKPGISTKDIDDYARALMKKSKVKPAFLGYNGFPASVCVSIDQEVVHGIPAAKRILREGQIVSLDLGVLNNGFYGDMALTVPVGDVDDEKRKLLKVADEAMEEAIKQCRVGLRLGDVSSVIQKKAESNGYSVVRDFVGHGIGRKMHQDPQIPNYGEPDTGTRLQKGMVFALEPMINAGTYEVEVLEDNWTVVTKDRRPSVHIEKMVAVGENGPVVLAAL